LHHQPRIMKGKVVVITGASSGIGLALARECGQRGAHVVLAARNREKLQAISEELKAKGIDNIIIQADVSQEQDCRRLVEETIAKYGTLNVLINNAGISMRASFMDLHLDVIRKVMDTNFWGTVHCTKYALPYLLKNKGSLVGVSSIAGYKGLPGRTGYSSSKFAMQGFLEVLRIENLKKGLHVLIACPGFTASNIRNTALTADGSVQGESPRDEDKMMTAEEVARRIAIAIEKRKRSLILTSQGKMTVVLNKFFPGFMDKMTYNHMAKEENAPLK
jgi:dehydrogenase/reductase SDR family member 7B